MFVRKLFFFILSTTSKPSLKTVFLIPISNKRNNQFEKHEYVEQYLVKRVQERRSKLEFYAFNKLHSTRKSSTSHSLLLLEEREMK